MDEERKIFGMTRTQISILAGLAGILVLIACIGGLVILRGVIFNLSAPSTPTPNPTVTAASVVAPTMTPTITPTAVPYEQVVPAGWEQYKTSLVEIWLPQNFKTADKSLLKDYTGLAIPELVLSGTPGQSSPYNMVVGVSYKPMTGESFDSFLNAELLKLPQQAHLVENRKITVNGTPGVRFVFEIRSDNNIDINDLTYVFLDGTTVWYVEFAAQINDFYENLSMFEQSVKTFRIVR